MPTGDLNKFIKDLDDALQNHYKPKAEFLICGDKNTEFYIIDKNTDYFIERNRKKQLASILTT